MQIAQVIGGYTLGGADLLRRAMGKKKPEEMAQAARHLRRRRRRRTALDASQGDAALRPDGEVRRLRLQQVALPPRMRWSPTRPRTSRRTTPPAFMAANLSLVMDDTDKVQARSTTTRVAQGLAILPPDVNASGYRFEPVDAAASATASAASRARAKRPSRRSSPRATRAARSPTCSTSAAASTSGIVNRRVVEALITRRRVRRDRSAAMRRCSRRSAWRSTPANARSPRRRRFRCSARRRRHTSQR